MAGAQHSPEEVDAIQREIEADVHAGVGDRHFQDVLDVAMSKQGSAHVDETPELREQMARFCRALHGGLSEQVASQGFRCVIVKPDGKGTGFVIRFRDAQQRPFEVSYTYDEGLEAAALRGAEFMGRQIVDEIVKKLLAARERYFARMVS